MRYCYVLYNILLATCIFAQPMSKQEQMSALLTQVVRANAFNSLYPQEKVYLHFDNTAYFSGETIWFSAHVVDATTGDTARSKVLYVELLSPTGVVLEQQKLKVEDGRCHGSFALIDAGIKEANAKRGVLGYPSGFYEVRAYTRTMLNFDAHCCFSRVFPVYDTPDKEGDYERPVMKRYKRYEEIRPQTKKAKNLNVAFFPEGGHLVLGVPNRIAFKATDNHGKGVNVNGIMIDGESVPVSSLHLGMGYFIYTPEEKRHKASILLGEKTYTFSLPEAEEEGYAIQTNLSMGDTLHVTIATLQPDTTRLLAMTLMHAGKMEYADTLTIGVPIIHEAIPTHELPTGVYQLYLYDAGGAVHATRMLFLNNGMSTHSITITTDKPYYQPFEKIVMCIESASKAEQHVSLAVRDAADYGMGYSEDIRSYMLLSSELKGYIEHPEYYFESNDAAHRDALDCLMMVQGWSRYNLEKMQRPISFDEIHYTEGCLVLEGRALHPRKDEPMCGVDINLRLYSPDRKQVQEISTTSDEHGYWGVNLQDYEGQWDLNIQTYRDGEPVVSRLRLERSSAPEVMPYDLVELQLQYDVDTTALIITDAEEKKWALPSESRLLDEVVVEGHRRYVDFCTFQAFDVEKDKELMIDKGEYTHTVADYLRDKGYVVTYMGMEDDTLKHSAYHRWLMMQYAVNGYRTLWNVIDGKKNLTTLSYTPGFDIDIEDVKSVLIYDTPHSYLGNPEVYRVLDESDMLFPQKPDKIFPAGLYVVEIHLYPNRKNNIAWYKNTRQTTFEGYSPKVEYYSPEYPDGPIEGDKDYRRTLYWNPDVKISEGRADVTFYNNSYSKRLHVRADGLTRNGGFIVYDSEKEN